MKTDTVKTWGIWTAITFVAYSILSAKFEAEYTGLLGFFNTILDYDRGRALGWMAVITGFGFYISGVGFIVTALGWTVDRFSRRNKAEDAE